MKLQMVGCSHHNAPLEIRERLAFSPEQAAAALARWREEFPNAEAVLLSTCNRVEVYTASENAKECPTHQQVAEFLAEFHGLDLVSVFDDLFEQSGEGMVRHLFTVAASLDSMVVGEPQILAQVKQAYQLAKTSNAPAPRRTRSFRRPCAWPSAWPAKPRSTSAASASPASPSADFAREIFERFDDKQRAGDRRRRNGRRDAALPARRGRPRHHGHQSQP